MGYRGLRKIRHLNGLNAGDYNASVSLERYVSRQIGYLQVGFQNVNRTLSSVFDPVNPFYTDTLKNQRFSKENTANLFASLDDPLHHFKLTGSYYLMSNYGYFTNYFQAAAAIHLIQPSADTSCKSSLPCNGPLEMADDVRCCSRRRGSSPVHVPLIVSFNQIGYDGNLGYRYLNISFGMELRYISGYKADGYAPLSGQFFTQSDTTIRQHLPDITPYVNLRIRSFTAYLRMENLNTMQFGPNGFGFTNNNFIAPNYPSPGLLIRFGFFWGFVN